MTKSLFEHALESGNIPLALDRLRVLVQGHSDLSHRLTLAKQIIEQGVQDARDIYAAYKSRHASTDIQRQNSQPQENLYDISGPGLTRRELTPQFGKSPDIDFAADIEGLAKADPLKEVKQIFKEIDTLVYDGTRHVAAHQVRGLALRLSDWTELPANVAAAVDATQTTGFSSLSLEERRNRISTALGELQKLEQQIINDLNSALDVAESDVSIQDAINALHLNPSQRAWNEIVAREGEIDKTRKEEWNSYKSRIERALGGIALGAAVKLLTPFRV